VAITTTGMSIATEGRICGTGPSGLSIATHGYVCLVGVVVVVRPNGGDSSKRGLRVEPIHKFETPAMIRRRILQEDEEILMIISTIFGVINDD